LTLRHGYEFFGPDNLLYGSDYPFNIGDALGNAQIIDELNVHRREKEKIFYENACKLLKL